MSKPRRPSSRNGRLTRKILAAAGILAASVTALNAADSPAQANTEVAPDFPYVYPMNGEFYVWSGPGGSHEGYDQFGDESQTPVYAMHSGLVKTGVSDTYCHGGTDPGRYIVIEHGDASSNAGWTSTYTRYHHLSSFAVPDGTWVAAGELIGYEGVSGSSGCSEHLHFEFRRYDGLVLEHNDIDSFVSSIPSNDTRWTTALSPIGFHGFWALRASTSSSSADRTVLLGQAGDIPVTGDWNGDGYDSIGVVRYDNGNNQLKWYLSNADLHQVSHGSAVAADVGPFYFGEAGDRPLAGDWDDDGRDAPAIVRRTTESAPGSSSLKKLQYYMAYDNYSSTMCCQYIPKFGYWPGDFPVAGDWNSDGKDSPGMFHVDATSWSLTNTTYTSSNSTHYYISGWGQSPDVPLAGDWKSNGSDRPVVYQKFPNSYQTGMTWFRMDDLNGNGLNNFSFGGLGDYPLILNWDTDSLDEYAVGQ